MYTAGKLIYFGTFYFKNNNESKSKYFLVLKNIGENAILASLPSSKVHLPQSQEIKHGCLEIPESCINCYILQANRPITKNNWSFQLDTFLYGQYIDDFSIEGLNEKYQIEGVDYEIVGELIHSELENIIKCFCNSANVKRRYKRLLS